MKSNKMAYVITELRKNEIQTYDNMVMKLPTYSGTFYDVVGTVKLEFPYGLR